MRTLQLEHFKKTIMDEAAKFGLEQLDFDISYNYKTITVKVNGRFKNDNPKEIDKLMKGCC